jgi:transcriptional regulator
MGGVYQPPAHAEHRVPVLHELVRRAALGHLVTLGAEGLVANAVPLLLDAHRGPLGTLVGHLARANPQWQDVQATGEALVIFAWPDAYVVVVHARGPLVVHDDPAWVEGLVRRLTAEHERGRPEPWAVDDAPRRFVEGMLRSIVGIEVPIRHLEGKRKLSQNRPEGDIAGVVAAFDAAGPREQAVAGAMREAMPGLGG